MRSYRHLNPEEAEELKSEVERLKEEIDLRIAEETTLLKEHQDPILKKSISSEIKTLTICKTERYLARTLLGSNLEGDTKAINEAKNNNQWLQHEAYILKKNITYFDKRKIDWASRKERENDIASLAPNMAQNKDFILMQTKRHETDLLTMQNSRQLNISWMTHIADSLKDEKQRLLDKYNLEEATNGKLRSKPNSIKKISDKTLHDVELKVQKLNEFIKKVEDPGSIEYKNESKSKIINPNPLSNAASMCDALKQLKKDAKLDKDRSFFTRKKSGIDLLINNIQTVFRSKSPSKGISASIKRTLGIKR